MKKVNRYGHLLKNTWFRRGLYN